MSDPIGDRPVAATSAVSATAAPQATGKPLLLPDGWTVTVTEKIVTTVDAVAAKTTKPITLVARGLVYGLLLGTAGIAALVLLTAFVLRSLVVLVGLIPVLDDRAGRSVWIVDLLIGLGLISAGTLFMRKGRAPKPEPDAR
jgi:hypothetical protein